MLARSGLSPDVISWVGHADKRRGDSMARTNRPPYTFPATSLSLDQPGINKTPYFRPAPPSVPPDDHAQDRTSHILSALGGKTTCGPFVRRRG
jgi:hypothetical protein